MSEAAITRKAIRNDAAARLVAAGTPAGSRVYGFRTTPVPEDKLPALLVYVANDNGENRSIAVPVFRRVVELSAECIIAGGTDEELGDTLEDFADGVTGALLNDPEFVRQFEQIPSVRYEAVAVIDGARRMACGKLTFSLQFSAEYPPTLADAVNLSTVELSVDTIEPAGQLGATATITLPAP